jgi:hypothetical protein
MGDDQPDTAAFARKLLFELQDLVTTATNAGVNSVQANELIRRATVASRIGMDDGALEIVKLLREGKALVESALTDSFLGDLTEIRSEIQNKREKLPGNHYIYMSYTNAVNALKRKDFADTLKNINICKKELARISVPVKDRAYGKYFANESTPCASCGGRVRPGYVVVKCICGNTHHESCAMREGHCTCGAKFGRQGQMT